MILMALGLHPVCSLFGFNPIPNPFGSIESSVHELRCDKSGSMHLSQLNWMGTIARTINVSVGQCKLNFSLWSPFRRWPELNIYIPHIMSHYIGSTFKSSRPSLFYLWRGVVRIAFSSLLILPFFMIDCIESLAVTK